MKNAIGIEIGSAGVRAARVSLSKQPELEAFHQALLPAGAMRDGEILESRPVEKAVSAAVREVGGSKRIAVAVANQKVVARIAELPYMEERDLRGAIRYQVQDLIPIPMESAVLDFQILQEFTNEDQQRMMRVLVVAAHKEMINTYISAIEKAGYSPEAVDFTPLALMRSLGSKTPKSAKTSDVEVTGDGEALIDVGADLTSMVVRHQEVPNLARVLAVGGSEEPETLVGEIRSSIKFYMGQSDERPISRALLSGEMEELEGVAPMLAQALNVPVEVGTCSPAVRISKGLSKKLRSLHAEPLVAVAVGAALGALDS